MQLFEAPLFLSKCHLCSTLVFCSSYWDPYYYVVLFGIKYSQSKLLILPQNCAGYGRDSDTTRVFFQHLVHEHLMEFVEHYFKWWGANGDILNKEEYEQYEKPLDLMVTLTVLYEN